MNENNFPTKHYPKEEKNFGHSPDVPNPTLASSTSSYLMSLSNSASRNPLGSSLISQTLTPTLVGIRRLSEDIFQE